MSATNSPRRSDRPSYQDPHAIDLSWAMGRARDWLLGPAPLIANLSLFLFAGLGVVLWRLSQNPDGFSLPGWVVVWGVLVAIHAGGVVAYGTLRAWRSPRRGPVYYDAIPPEERTTSRRSAPALRPTPVAVERPTWQGVLAPVTPFPTLGGRDRSGTSLPAAPDHADVSAVHQPAPDRSDGTDPFDGQWPVTAHRDSALADVRDVLASDQPLWRRWRRRTSDRGTPADLPIDSDRSWLSPFPGAPPVTRPAPAAPLFPAETDESRTISPPATDRRWPASVASNGAASPPAGRAADGEQIPSLAAMLRSSNLTSLSDAPIQPRPARPTADDREPAPLPAAPIPFSRSSASPATPPGTSALFAAFGIDGDGKPVRRGKPGQAAGTTDPVEPDRPEGPAAQPRDPNGR